MRQRKGGFEIVLDSRRPCTGRCAHHLIGSSPRSPRSPREIFRSAFMSDLRRSGSLGILFPRTRVGVGRDPDKKAHQTCANAWIPTFVGTTRQASLGFPDSSVRKRGSKRVRKGDDWAAKARAAARSCSGFWSLTVNQKKIFSRRRGEDKKIIPQPRPSPGQRVRGKKDSRGERGEQKEACSARHPDVGGLDVIGDTPPRGVSPSNVRLRIC